MEIDILKEAGCPNWVIAHSIAVYKKAMEIAMLHDDVNMDLIRKSTLLHDIGRSKTNGIDHAIVGARIVKELGFSEDVSRAIERHIGTGISEKEAESLGLPIKNYIPETIEEKIVSHADNLLNGDDEVTVEFTMKKWERKLGKGHPSIEQIQIIHKELVG